MSKSTLKRFYWSIALLILLPFALQFLPGIPFAAAFLLVAFVCSMCLFFIVWPKRPATGRRYLWGFIPFVWSIGFVAFIAGWRNQPYFGANICPTKGFMREADFLEIMRPNLIESIQRTRTEALPTGATIEAISADANAAIDIFKQCLAERGRKYCRYAGPNENGDIDANYFSATVTPEDRAKYRFLKKDISYEISIVPVKNIGSFFTFSTWRSGTRFTATRKMCEIGCDCNLQYGFR